MKTFVALTALTAGANGLVSRAPGNCCFQLSGGGGGKVGQLGDGQNRIGDKSLPPATFCINNSGGLTDSHGRGCILTREFSYDTDRYTC